MKILALIILCYYLCFAFSYKVDPNACGHQNGGRICPRGLCCSHEGYCDSDEAHCGDCQSSCPGEPVPTPECGWQAGGKNCTDGRCCSQYGFCGHTGTYCLDGCQSNCGNPGVCKVNDHQCGKQNGGRICGSDYYCSDEGWCHPTTNFGVGCQNNCPDKNNTEPECGRLNNDLPCPDGKCCSQYGFCGTDESYCDINCFCQSNCWPLPVPPSPPPPPPPTLPPPPPPTPTPPPSPSDDKDVGSIITEMLFEKMLLHRNDPACAVAPAGAANFYTYEAFIEAAKFFEGFGTTGDLETRKRELAAFFGQTSHETTGGWDRAPDGKYAWGYCFKREISPGWNYCVDSQEWPCVPGKSYYGRGPIQISYNYNYGPAGKAIDYCLLRDPDAVENDPIISFETAIWFWMTPQPPKPSCHDVMTGRWRPSESDKQAGRFPGYGVTTNIINGGLECGIGPDDRVIDRIGFYERYCSDDILGVSPGENLDCYNQRPFNSGIKCSGINCVADM